MASRIAEARGGQPRMLHEQHVEAFDVPFMHRGGGCDNGRVISSDEPRLAPTGHHTTTRQWAMVAIG